MWKAPSSPITAAGAAAVPLGMARAAWGIFGERLPNRGIAYTHYEQQSSAPLTHIQLARASIAIDEAAHHVRFGAERVAARPPRVGPGP